MKSLSYTLIFALMCVACDNADSTGEIYNENNTNVIEGIVYDIDEHPINGMYKIYYPDGKLRMEVESKNGKPHGVGKTYDENGNLQYKATFNDGVLDGEVYQYYPNGSVHNEMNYANGVLQGIQKTYDENKKQIVEVIYDQGVPVSGVVFIDDNRVDLSEAELQQFE